MKDDLYMKVVLTAIAICLLALTAHVVLPRFEPVAYADMGKINYTKDGGTGVACSADGKYVFIAGNEGVIVSDDFGRVGSWQKTIKEDLSRPQCSWAGSS